MSQTMAQALSRQGVEVLVGTTVSEVEVHRPDGVALRLSDGTRREAERCWWPWAGPRTRRTSAWRSWASGWSGA